MKIKFSYQPGEEKRAYLVCNLVIASLRKMDGKNPRVKERQEHPLSLIHICSRPASAQSQITGSSSMLWMMRRGLFCLFGLILSPP